MAQFILFDFWISLFAAATTGIVSFASFHAYNLGGRVRQSHFGFGFLFLSASLLLGVIVNAQLRWPHITNGLRPYVLVDTINGGLVMFATTLLLLGLSVIFMTLERLENKPIVFLIAHVVAFTLLIANEYFSIVYAEMTILIAVIAVNFYRNWRRHHNVTSFCTMVAFMSTFVAHAALVVSNVYEPAGVLYFVGNALAILFLFTGTLYLYLMPRSVSRKRSVQGRKRR